MPETEVEKTFPFPTAERMEGQLIGKIANSEIAGFVQDGMLVIKFVMSYCLLKQD